MSWEKDRCITHVPWQVFLHCRSCGGASNKDSQLTVLTSLVPMIPPISPRSLSSKFKISVALFFWWLLSSCNWPSSLWVAVRALWKGIKAEVTLPSANWAPVLLQYLGYTVLSCIFLNMSTGTMYWHVQFHLAIIHFHNSLANEAYLDLLNVVNPVRILFA